MDGDIADLPRLVELKEKYDAWLMVDEAHAWASSVPRDVAAPSISASIPIRVDIWMGTLSKTLAACGGYIAGKQELIDILKYQAPGMVYSVGLSPPLAAAALRGAAAGRRPSPNASRACRPTASSSCRLRRRQAWIPPPAKAMPSSRSSSAT